MAAEGLELFTPELVFIDMDCADRDDFFKKMSVELGEKGYVEDTWYDAITTREANYPTGLMSASCSVAIPHTEPENIKKAYIAVIKPKNPIEFNFMGGMGDPVQAELIFNLGIKRKGDDQVKMLQTLMNFCMNDEAVEEIKAAGDPDAVISVIEKYFA